MSKAAFASSRASRVTELATLLLLLALLIVLVLELPSDVFSPESQSFFFAVGAIGAWRYSWWFTHAARSFWYNRVRFPQLRRQADATARAVRPDTLYVLCTSYRIDPAVTFPVYEALVRECGDYGVPTTIFASVSDRTDVDVIHHVLERCGRPANVSVRYMFQRGDGKRSAMAEVLRAISRRMPGPSSLLVSMDGDILLEPGTLARSLPFLLMRSDLGAITTNNRARVTGGDATREWYDLRYAQRHLMMSSMSISERQLVLTGRYSVFRADVAVDREFIRTVESDHIDHWRFGTFAFLSGDDKSTWFCLLKRGWKMLYLPDVYVSGFEELPDRQRQLAADEAEGGSDNRWLAQALTRAPEGGALRLPPGRVALDHRLLGELAAGRDVHVEGLLGAGGGATTVLSLSPELADRALERPGAADARRAASRCGVDAGCALALGGEEIALERLEVRVR